MSKIFETMKNMKNTLMILMAVALIALPTMAQQNWTGPHPTYGNTYQPQRTAAPAGSFHSAGNTMMNSGSMYSSNPVVNRHGAAVYNGPGHSPARISSKPRKGGLIDWGDGEDVDPENPGEYTGNLEPGDPGYDPSSGGNVFDPDPNDEDGAPNGWGTPIGDAVLPLLLLAGAYMCLRPFLKRKRATES